MKYYKLIAIVFIVCEMMMNWRHDKRHANGKKLRFYISHATSNLTVAILVAFCAASFDSVLRVLNVNIDSWHLLDLSSWSTVSIWVFSFVFLDFISYITHVMSHQIPFLWRLHSVHHSDSHLDTTTKQRFHPFNAIYVKLIAIISGLLVGVPAELLFVNTVIVEFIGCMQHTSLPVPSFIDRTLRFLHIAAAPSFHRIHHSPVEQQTNTNYGTIFTFYDKIFGTYCYRETWREDPVGLYEYSDSYWSTVEGILATPFRGLIGERLQSGQDNSGS